MGWGGWSSACCLRFGDCETVLQTSRSSFLERSIRGVPGPLCGPRSWLLRPLRRSVLGVRGLRALEPAQCELRCPPLRTDADCRPCPLPSATARSSPSHPAAEHAESADCPLPPSRPHFPQAPPTTTKRALTSRSSGDPPPAPEAPTVSPGGYDVGSEFHPRPKSRLDNGRSISVITTVRFATDIVDARHSLSMD